MALLQVLLMGLEDPHSFEDRLNDLEDRLAALESAGRVSSSGGTSSVAAINGPGSLPPGLDYLTIRSVAETTQLSESHIRRAIRSGDSPASNVGTPDHPTWRISRKDLVEWMDRKKSGTSKVPPRSSLKDLVERHLPGL